MMRKWKTLAATVGAAVVLAGCGGSSESPEAAPTPTAPQEAPEEAPEEAPDEAEEVEEEALSEAVLRMSITDETSTGLPDRFEVWIRGSGSWFASQDTLLEEGGPFRIGEPVTFFIYPEGRDTPEIEVELVLPANVIPGSARDLVEIEVYDNEIKIFGTSVPGFEASYPR